MLKQVNIPRTYVIAVGDSCGLYFTQSLLENLNRKSKTD